MSKGGTGEWYMRFGTNEVWATSCVDTERFMPRGVPGRGGSGLSDRQQETTEGARSRVPCREWRVESLEQGERIGGWQTCRTKAAGRAVLREGDG